MAVFERTIKYTSEAGFPTKLYLGIVTWLAERGYSISKTKDWLEINPKTPYHQDVIQRRQSLEQSLGRVMSNISELRKDIEMIKHDVRKFEQVQTHCKEGKEEVLKSDFMDLIDDPSKPGSLMQLQANGRFPSIVIDFMRVNSKDDIKKLKVSQSEKNVLEIKIQLYNEWKDEYCKTVNDRVKILKEELNSRVASLESYKHSIQPYLQALNKIKISEGHYKGLTDPLMIEGYSTSVAGVELSAWKGMRVQDRFIEDHEEFSHFIYIELDIKRESITIKGQEVEQMSIKIKTDTVDNNFIKRRKKEIDSLEKNLEQELKEFRGESEKIELIEKLPDKKSGFDKLRNTIRKSVGHRGPYEIHKGNIKAMEETAVEESIKFYDDIKKMIGGLLLKHPEV